MSDTRVWVEPGWGPSHKWWTTPYVTPKAQAREGDHVGRRHLHRFNHDVRNSLHNLEQKVVQLRLREALEEDRAPRRRVNHCRPTRRDGGKAWDRMVAHGEAVAWQAYAGQSHRCR